MIVETSSVAGKVYHETVTVGTSQVTLTDTNRPLARGILVRADANNAGTVYVGGVRVTTTGVNAGLPLAAGDSIFIPVQDPSQVYLVASQASQAVCAIGV
jgi:hypothetical protein